MSQKKIVRSIQGSEVDFDLMKVKQSMLNRDKPNGVEVREQYIDIRRRRNPRRNVADLEREQQANVEDARAKIQQSKQNRIEAEAKATLEGNVEESVVATPVVEVNDESPAVITASSPEETKTPKKIVKKTTD
jgi:hypothetical protein